MEVAYYTCLNDECYKYRGIFIEDDPEHKNCERARIYPTRQTGMPMLAWFAIATVVAAAAGTAAMMYLRRNRKQDHLPPKGERRAETWSGTERMNNERTGYAAPPPIVPD